MRFSLSHCLLLCSAISVNKLKIVKAQGSDGLSVGDEVCIEGYLMDYFCIGMGTLFDNPTVATLGPEGPLVHSVHCLLDIPDCIASPFEILLPSASEDDDGFIRGWRLSDETKAWAVELAMEAGDCQTCSGTIDKGMHIGLRGLITDLGDSGMPPIVTVAEDNWSANMQVSDPNDPTSLLCGAGGSAVPPNQVTATGGEGTGGDTGATSQPIEEGDPDPSSSSSGNVPMTLFVSKTAKIIIVVTAFTVMELF